MRGKIVWLNVLALFGFLLAQVPVSTVASLRPPAKCSMPCCQGNEHQGEARQSCREIKSVANQVHRDCCATPLPTHELSSKTGSECNCKLRPSSDQHQQVATLSILPSQTHTELIAVLSNAAVIPVIHVDPDLHPSIFGPDSGPPRSRPHCVWIGRAPPVLFA